jgi:hypothetical protein
MSTIELDRLYLELDDLTKKGQRQLVLERLSFCVKNTKIPREQLARFAQIASRNNAHLTTLKILASEILQMQESRKVTLNSIINTYANALQFIGAIPEAKKILTYGDESPEKILTKSFILFSEWKYEQAVPLLKKYIRSTQITSYQRLVGYINLLASYSTLSELAKAQDLIELVEPLFAEHPTANILKGNFNEIKAQIYLLAKKASLASESLTLARALLEPYGGRYLLFVEKWEALWIAEKDPALGIDELKKVRKKAVDLNSFETIRDCDFHRARLMKNQAAIERILMATPTNAYRNKNIKAHNMPFKAGAFFSCQLQDLLLPAGPVDFAFEEILLKLNRTERIVAQTVFNDLYRSPRLGTLFSSLYPDEYFDPYTSPSRVRNAVKRLNQSLAHLKVPVAFEFKRGQLKVRTPEHLTISLPQRALYSLEQDLLYNLIRTHFKGRSFTEKMVQERFELNKNKTQRLFNDLVKVKKIIRRGLTKEKRFICNNRRSFI